MGSREEYRSKVEQTIAEATRKGQFREFKRFVRRVNGEFQFTEKRGKTSIAMLVERYYHRAPLIDGLSIHRAEGFDGLGDYGPTYEAWCGEHRGPGLQQWLRSVLG